MPIHFRWTIQFDNGGRRMRFELMRFAADFQLVRIVQILLQSTAQRLNDVVYINIFVIFIIANYNQVAAVTLPNIIWYQNKTRREWLNYYFISFFFVFRFFFSFVQGICRHLYNSKYVPAMNWGVRAIAYYANSCTFCIVSSARDNKNNNGTTNRTKERIN